MVGARRSCRLRYPSSAIAFYLLTLQLVAATASAQTSRQDPAAYVRTIYTNYPKYRNTIQYTPRLQSLLDDDEKADSNDPLGKLDFDPIVNGQDAKISVVTTKTVVREERLALVRAEFKNFDRKNVLEYTLVWGDRGWMIAEIKGISPRSWTLTKILAP